MIIIVALALRPKRGRLGIYGVNKGPTAGITGGESAGKGLKG